jgi:hypothetical protein
VQKITTEVDGVKEEISVGETEGVFAAISFAIPLAAGLNGSHVHYQTDPNFNDFDEGGPETVGCKGSNITPSAPPGHLCVYNSASAIKNATFISLRDLGNVSKGASKAGALLKFEPTGAARGFGAWAVTG